MLEVIAKKTPLVIPNDREGGGGYTGHCTMCLRGFEY